eukprot:1143584-Pelagomonas_calceolata.AAC.3
MKPWSCFRITQGCGLAALLPYARPHATATSVSARTSSYPSATAASSFGKHPNIYYSKYGKEYLQVLPLKARALTDAKGRMVKYKEVRGWGCNTELTELLCLKRALGFHSQRRGPGTALPHAIRLNSACNALVGV